MPDESSSSSTDGELLLKVPPGTDINLRLLAASDHPSWRWSSSSSTTTGAAPAPAPGTTQPAKFNAGDVDIWLTAGKSILVRLEVTDSDDGQN